MTAAQKAHLKLMSELPIRSHFRAPAKRKVSAGQAKPITVDGVLYEGFRACWRDLHISPMTLTKWLQSGRAVYE